MNNLLFDKRIGRVAAWLLIAAVLVVASMATLRMAIDRGSDPIVEVSVSIRHPPPPAPLWVSFRELPASQAPHITLSPDINPPGGTIVASGSAAYPQIPPFAPVDSTGQPAWIAELRRALRPDEPT